MPKGPMSPAAKKRISDAMKRRWATYRKAKAAGQPVPKMGPRKGKKRGRPLGSRNVRRGRPAKSENTFLGMTVEALLAAKKQLDHAMSRVRELLHGSE